jgi:NAD(P)-dependent dehydrogenase (short-subunit alcohol dehydrogenase family)
MKTFLGIGSGPGIGLATAERFAREGFRIVL